MGVRLRPRDLLEPTLVDEVVVFIDTESAEMYTTSMVGSVRGV